MKRTTALYAFLTLLVWGLFALDQGLFHDDAAHLAWAAQHAGAHLNGLFEPMGSPTRRLLAAPYIVAWASPAPAAVLQLCLGAAWLATGFAVRALVRRAGGSAGAALVAGALALAATSDLLTNSSLALGYVLSSLAFVAALAAALFAQSTGRGAPLILTVLLLEASLFTTDGAAPAAVLAPVFLLACSGRADRAWLRVSAAWALALVPYGILLVRFLKDPSGYAAAALVSRPPLVRARLFAALAAHDFMPWRWAFRNPVWIERLPAIFPVWLVTACALAGAASFLATARAGDAATGVPVPIEDRRRERRLAAALVLLILATHAAFSGVQLAEVRFRTQLLTRLFASMLIALAAEALSRRLRRPRLALALPTLFVGLGVAGGLERQDTYLATWRRQRAELASILEAAPALDPKATLVLSLEPDPGGFQATRVPYLAESWMTLLQGDSGGSPRVIVWLRGWGDDCREEPSGLACRADTGGSAAGTTSWDRLVLLSFDAASGHYRLIPSIPASGGAYRPEALIRSAVPTPHAREILAGPRFLAHLFPDAGAPEAILARR